MWAHVACTLAYMHKICITLWTVQYFLCYCMYIWYTLCSGRVNVLQQLHTSRSAHTYCTYPQWHVYVCSHTFKHLIVLTYRDACIHIYCTLWRPIPYAGTGCIYRIYTVFGSRHMRRKLPLASVLGSYICRINHVTMIYMLHKWEHTHTHMHAHHFLI